MIEVGIVGGTGYTGAELLRLLVGHPGVRVRVITSRQAAGRAVADEFPHLRGRCDLAFAEPDPALLAGCQAVFLATPHATAMRLAPDLLEAGARVLDLSADFRLRDAQAFRRWYGVEHAAPALLKEAVYGLPEVHRDRVRNARLVACPGCYPTSVQLGLLPLVEQGLAEDGSVVADCKSGVSGAGREIRPGSLYAESAETLAAYKVDGHRHQPEIEQGLADIAGAAVPVTFVPHLAPMVRGIHATLYANLRQDVDLQALYERRYAQEPFVDVLPAGSHPQTRSVSGSNRCRIAVHRPGGGRRAVVLAVIDNLVKGASGQAVQCLNLMFGQPETAGLEQAPAWP